MKRLMAVTCSLIALCAVYGGWTSKEPAAEGSIEFVTLTPADDPANPYNRFPAAELKAPSSEEVAH